MSSDDEKITYRRWLTEGVAVHCALNEIPFDPFMVLEAISSTALEHPEWDMEEMKTREEWWEHERRISRPGP